MNGNQKPVVFIGSGEASRLERKVLMHSLRKNTRQALDIRVFNGTHNSVEADGQAPFAAPMPLSVKYQNVTEFSNYRFIIPELCSHSGRAIWLDSDMICLGDVSDLFHMPMGDADFLAKAEAYGASETRQWGLSVALFDCTRCGFDVAKYFDEIGQGLYSYGDLHQMTSNFLQRHAFRIGALDPKWNEFDRHDADTKLIHYTNLYMQPWKYRSHPYGDLWFRYFEEAYKSGFITDRDIELTLVRSYARRDLLDGNRWTPVTYMRHVARELAAELRCIRARFR